MPAKPKAYSYLRFSTPEQIKGDSLRRQTAAAEDYCRAHGLELDTELNLRDLGVSAFRGDNVTQGALGAFLQAVRQGIVPKGSYLLVESLDRVSRKAAYRAQAILTELVEEGVKVVTLSDGKVYDAETLENDPFAFLYAILIFIRAHEESAMKARRLKAAWVGKRLRVTERALTAITPGWIKLDEQRRPVLIEDRARVVRRIVKDYLRGIGKHSIAVALNAEGVPPFGRAKHWHRSYIHKILTSPALVGTFIPHVEEHREGKRRRIPQEPVLNYFPAVIDTETYERLRGLIGRSPLRGRHAKAEMRNVLSGLARCPACDSTMTRVFKGPNGGKPFLVCTRAKSGAGCTYRTVRYEDVEAALLKGYEQLIEGMPHPDERIERELRRAQVNLDAIEDRLSELMSLLERRPSDALAARIAALDADLKEARRLRDELLAHAAQSQRKVIQMKAETLRAAMRARPLNRERINAALRELLDGVVIDYESGHLRFRWRAGGESELVYAWPRAVR